MLPLCYAPPPPPPPRIELLKSRAKALPSVDLFSRIIDVEIVSQQEIKLTIGPFAQP